MELSRELQIFRRACERILGKMAIERPLTEEEQRAVEHYCKEVRRMATLSTNRQSAPLSSAPDP